MVETNELDPRFMELASRFLDGVASAEELEALDLALKSDPPSIRILAELLNQHGTLALSLRGEAAYKERLPGLNAPAFSGADEARGRRAWWMAIPVAACVAIIATVALYQGQNSVSRSIPGLPEPRSISFQDGVSPTSDYRGTRDTRICEHRPAQRFGKESLLEVEGGDEEGESSALLRWDLSAIPPGSRIHSAVFTFNVPRARERDSLYRIWEVRRDWAEDDATWSLARREGPWEVAGAKGSQDRGLSALAEFRAKKGLLEVSLKTPGLRAIERWVATPGQNHGILVAYSAEAGEFYLSSRETEAASSRPKLTIAFSPP